jgi:mannose/cellobiose epimerase-like protein (N-acyl-D-glucosamine 2-epimerase family)
MEERLIPEAILKLLPANARKVVEAAESHGWELNGKGASFCLRLDHPSDDLAVPFYITWQVGETAKGALSFRYMSAATATLQPLSAGDVLEYLADPTLIHGDEDEETA